MSDIAPPTLYRLLSAGVQVLPALQSLIVWFHIDDGVFYNAGFWNLAELVHNGELPLLRRVASNFSEMPPCQCSFGCLADLNKLAGRDVFCEWTLDLEWGTPS